MHACLRDYAILHRYSLLSTLLCRSVAYEVAKRRKSSGRRVRVGVNQAKTRDTQKGPLRFSHATKKMLVAAVSSWKKNMMQSTSSLVFYPLSTSIADSSCSHEFENAEAKSRFPTGI